MIIPPKAPSYGISIEKASNSLKINFSESPRMEKEPCSGKTALWAKILWKTQWNYHKFVCGFPSSGS
jgi:hypothetical protein